MSIALIIILCALLVNTLTVVVVLYRDNKEEHNKISKQIDALIKEIDKQNKTFEKNRSQPLEVIIRK